MADGVPPNFQMRSVERAVQMIPVRPSPNFMNPSKWSADLKDFLSKCLHKDPKERFSSTQLLAVRFSRFLFSRTGFTTKN
jgi:serine/threonine protein kinase